MPRHSPSIKPLTLHSVFQSHAVVQRDCLLPVFGTGEPGATVRCSFARRRAVTTVRPDGTWKVELPAIPAGGPFRLVAESGDSKAVASDVLVGDVFLCSGQSNMEWPLNAAQGGKEAIAAVWPSFNRDDEDL
jgi:sialate O-acetylesterase